MKIRSVLILVGVCLAVVRLSDSAFLDACGGQYNTTVKTPIFVNFSNVTNQTCVWYIQRDENSSTNLHVSFSLLTTNSSITVYSGRYQINSTQAKVIKTYTAGDTVSDELVISADKVTSIVFHNKNTTQGSLNVTYSGDECINQVEWAKPIVAPIYLPGTGPVTCVYHMTLPSDKRTSVMSFTDFSLVKGSLLIQNGNISHTLTAGTNIPDDLLLGTNGNLSLTIALNNNTALQHFKAFMTEADPVCTREVIVNGSLPVPFSLPSEQSLPLDCLVIVKAPVNTTLVTIVQDLVLPEGSNSVILRDGGSQSSPEISTLLSSNENGQLIVTSGNKLFMQIRLEKSLDKSSVNLNFKQQGGGAGRYHGSGKVSLDASHFTGNNSVYFLLTVPDGRAQVSFVNGKINNATLEVFDGNTPSNEIAVFKKVSDFYTITGSGQSILIRANNFLNMQTFTANYNTIRPDCDQLSTGPYGTYSMIGKSGTQCTWSIKPQSSAWLLDLTMGRVTLCQNDTLALYEGLTKSVITPIITLNAKTQNTLVPSIFSQSQNGFRLVLKSPNGSCSKNDSAIVTSSYQTNMAKCGGTLNAPTGIVNSPQYPNQYPLNAHCKWTFDPKKKPFILVSVSNLDLNPKHSLTVDDGKKKMSLAGYTDVDLLVPTTNKSNLVLDFNSVNSNMSGVPTTGRGFNIIYTYFDCGQKIVADKGGVIDVSSKTWNTSHMCVWQIQAPSSGKANNSSILSLNVSITGNTKWDVLTIYDGGSRKSPLLEFKAKGESVNTLTRGPYVMVVLRHTSQTSNLTTNSTFQLKINYTTYTCPSTQKCQNGFCIHPDWYCNGVNNCGDNTDEINCTYPVPIATTTTPKPPKPGRSSEVKSYVVVIVALVCLALGIVLAIGVPAIYKRIKYPNYRHLQDLSVTT